jgi:Domain of Unknown Function (DUF1206)
VRKLGGVGAGSERGTVVDEARRETNAVERRRPFKWLVRVGFLARGVTYGLIGALALALALGAGTAGAAPNQQGALALIARTPLGRVALIVICAGLLGYAAWKLTLGVLGRGPEGAESFELKDRVANVAAGIGYLVFFAVAVRILISGSGKSSETPSRAAAGVLGWPGGQLIVGLAGAVLIGIGIYQVIDALRGGFADDNKLGNMSSQQRGLFMVLGRVGLTGRALVFALIGYFLVRTAIDFNAHTAVGVDGALARLEHQPLGSWLVGLVAVGLLTFACFSLFEARYRRL